jgi:hypothetical protein
MKLVMKNGQVVWRGVDTTPPSPLHSAGLIMTREDVIHFRPDEPYVEAQNPRGRTRVLKAAYRMRHNRWVAAVMPDMSDTMWQKYIAWIEGYDPKPPSRKECRARKRNGKPST